MPNIFVRGNCSPSPAKKIKLVAKLEKNSVSDKIFTVLESRKTRAVVWCLRHGRRAVETCPQIGGENMRVVKIIIRITALTGAILLLLSKTAA